MYINVVASMSEIWRGRLKPPIPVWQGSVTTFCSLSALSHRAQVTPGLEPEGDPHRGRDTPEGLWPWVTDGYVEEKQRAASILMVLDGLGGRWGKCVVPAEPQGMAGTVFFLSVF